MKMLIGEQNHDTDHESVFPEDMATQLKAVINTQRNKIWHYQE